MNKKRTHHWMGSSIWVATPLLAVAALLSLPGQVVSQAADNSVTYARDVAPILQNSCQMCHQPGGIGPMSLMTYEQARQWAPLIKERVESRFMPPWHIDRTVGIQEFKDDLSLSDEQIATISRWADAGAPLGDLADMPPPVKWPDATVWQLEEEFGRPPDLIIRSDPYTVRATGLDQWWHPTVTVEGLDKPRYARAIETKPSPGSRPVTHHGNSNISKFAIGKPYDVFPPNVGRIIEPGLEVGFNIHYVPDGIEAVEDAFLEVGMWFWPEDAEPRLKSTRQSFTSIRNIEGPAAQEIVIPPHGQIVTQGVTVLQKPGMIYSVRGHQHTHGAGQLIEAIYPDGRVEILSRTGWQFNWHITYTYEDHVMPLLPTGTVIMVTAWYDNTERPGNPDPDQWVIFGRRSADDMSHMHIGFVSMEEEDYEWMLQEREKLLEQRQQTVAQQGGGGQ
jgi:hypothetical protein